MASDKILKVHITIGMENKNLPGKAFSEWSLDCFIIEPFEEKVQTYLQKYALMNATIIIACCRGRYGGISDYQF